MLYRQHAQVTMTVTCTKSDTLTPVGLVVLLSDSLCVTFSLPDWLRFSCSFTVLVVSQTTPTHIVLDEYLINGRVLWLLAMTSWKTSLLRSSCPLLVDLGTVVMTTPATEMTGGESRVRLLVERYDGRCCDRLDYVMVRSYLISGQTDRQTNRGVW